ncbi:hypothetical protein [Brevibacillus borstelensis]|uniref:hypothetical protein n=1 Tax=Brevibacillus borstelensis TaxID=45462 RepID=UPI001D0A4E15|nr:hypothetical protein [Brevibacillus borstelensis]MCC0567212.1 hypothetical protein [Brevibacillus borstelensis]
MKMNLEIDLTNLESLRHARAILDFHISQLQSSGDNAQNIMETTQEDAHLKMLEEFAKGLSEKQRKTWDFFLNHPGNALATELKLAIPDLKPQGALAGVFKATQRWVTLGGQKEMCPFVQVDWSKTHGCGIYRGLTKEEIAFLKR